jgi:hypothetical protein
MTGAAISLRRSYEVHGVRVDVCAEDPAVLGALELRLRDFRRQPTAAAEVRFEFVTEGGNDRDLPELAADAGRPVYDTAYGSLRYHPQLDIVYGTLGGVGLRCEPRRGVALLSSSRFIGHDLYLATHPLTTISLIELLERRGLFALHAACLATPDGSGVLLSGPSGAGKSTLALALARQGMSFLSDDIVFLARAGDAPNVRVLGFADAIGITGHAAARFAELQAPDTEPVADGFPKRLKRIEDLFGSSALASSEPHALVFPEVVRDQPSALVPLDPGEALLRLVPDVLLTEPAATQEHLHAIAALLDQVRCYELRSGRDLERAAELVRAVA